MATNSSFRTLTLSNIEGIAEEKNYLKSNFENASTAGWNKFTTTLTGGVPTGSLTVGTAASITAFDAYAVNPLTGKLSLWVNSVPTGWVAGQGIISDVITIDRQDQGKVLNITFDYEPIQNPSSINFSGVLGQQTFAIYVYDVTASAWVQPAGFLSMTGRGISTARATFQTAMVAGQQYRVAIVCLQTTPSVAIGMLFDNFQMTRSNYIYGTPVTDWQSYTPTFQGFGTPTGVSFYWRRVGDSIEISGVFTAGTSTSVQAQMTLPNLWTINSSKVFTNTLVGEGTYNVNTAVSSSILANGGNNYLQFGIMNSTGYDGQTPRNGTVIATSGQSVNLFAKVPISGWSSSVQTSDSADTRVVAAYVGGSTSGQTLTANTTNVIFNSSINDTHGAYNSSTGIYTIPVSGFYKIAGHTRISTNTLHSFSVYVNGSFFADASPYITTQWNSLSCGAYFTAGQQVSIRCDASVVISNPTLSNTLWLYICRETGPSAIAASETVAASYFSTSGQQFNVGIDSWVDFATRKFDTHLIYTAPSGTYSAATGVWSVSQPRWTAPISGKYQLSCSIGTTSGASGVGEFRGIYIILNGSTTIKGSFISSTSYGTYTSTQNISTTIQLNAGDYIQIRYNQQNSAATARTMTAGESTNYLDIVRVGN